jgi:hypothetical protein
MTHRTEAITQMSLTTVKPAAEFESNPIQALCDALLAIAAAWAVVVIVKAILAALVPIVAIYFYVLARQ